VRATDRARQAEGAAGPLQGMCCIIFMIIVWRQVMAFGYVCARPLRVGPRTLLV
jgi:hypothetical protein